jgi:hypothetical protein
VQDRVVDRVALMAAAAPCAPATDPSDPVAKQPPGLGLSSGAVDHTGEQPTGLDMEHSILPEGRGAVTSSPARAASASASRASSVKGGGWSEQPVGLDMGEQPVGLDMEHSILPDGRAITAVQATKMRRHARSDSASSYESCVRLRDLLAQEAAAAAAQAAQAAQAQAQAAPLAVLAKLRRRHKHSASSTSLSTLPPLPLRPLSS